MIEPGRKGRRLAALGAVCLTVLVVAGCGSDSAPETVPEGSIAVIGEVPVTTGQYERRLKSELRGVAPLTGGNTGGVTLDPPGFDQCVSNLKARIVGSGNLTREQLVENCRLQYDQVRQSTVSQLIEEQWFIQQAESEGIALEPSWVEERLNQYVDLLGATPRQASRRFNSLLERSGLKREDLEIQLRAEIARQVILANAGVPDPPSDEDVREFFDENPQKFGKPADRTIEVLSTESEEKANEAKTRVEDGEPLAQVSVELSDDAPVRAADGIVKVEEGVENPLVSEAVADAVFEAGEGDLNGPVEIDGEWLLFRVLNSTQDDLPSFESVQEKARSLAEAEAASGGVEGALEDLEEQWRPRTLCAGGYLVSRCSNGS